MFTIPNTPIPFQDYDQDAGRSPQLQTFVSQAAYTTGYLFCSNQPIYIRLTVGEFGQGRQLPEFFVSPGAQGVAIDRKGGGQPITKVEVRAASTSGAQFWGVLGTETDPIGGFSPSPYSVTAGGVIVPPPTLTINFQQNGISKANEPFADFVDTVPGLAWTIVDDPTNTRAFIKGIQRTLIAHDQITADVTCTGTTDAGATNIVTTTSKVYDGVTPVIVTAFLQRCFLSGASATVANFVLYRDATLVGRWGSLTLPNLNGIGPLTFMYREIPTNAAHTYSLRGFCNVAAGFIAGAGAATGAVPVPGFIRTQYDL